MRKNSFFELFVAMKKEKIDLQNKRNMSDDWLARAINYLKQFNEGTDVDDIAPGFAAQERLTVNQAAEILISVASTYHAKIWPPAESEQDENYNYYFDGGADVANFPQTEEEAYALGQTQRALISLEAALNEIDKWPEALQNAFLNGWLLNRYR